MFSISSSDGQARCGALRTPSGEINTPNLLVYTHRGSPLNLTPDLLAKLPDVQGVQLDVLQYLNQPSPEVLRGAGTSGRAFLALEGRYVLVATARDPAIYEYAGATRQATNDWASVTVHTGSACVTPAQYMEAVVALAPDIWVALSDDIPNDSRSDRVPKAVDRSVAWLQQCLAAAAAAPELAPAAVFAAVQGGAYLQERQRCAEAVAAQPGVSGFLVAGLASGESAEQRRHIIDAVVAKLPPAAPRLVSGVGAPEEVLEAVAQGIDLFDLGTYLSGVTKGGYALTFPLSPEADEAWQPQQQEGQQQQQQQEQGQAAPAANGTTAAGNGAADGNAPADAAADAGCSDSKLSLWALAHRSDPRPLMPGCACFACGSHSRAYVHHLLQAHEMTAQVLLEAHNTHHCLQFFGAIRAAVAAGSFAAYRAWFLGRRQRWLAGEP